MKTKNNQLMKDVEELVERLVLADAETAVWNNLEKALLKFDGDSLSLFERYLDGIPISQLSKERNLSLEEVARWIVRLKRELIQQLKMECVVRN